MNVRMQTLVGCLIWSWIVVAVASALATASHTTHYLLSLILLLPLVILLAIFAKSIHFFLYTHRHDKLIFGSLAIVLLSHLMQVFVPETGFDAVWYHLPVIDHLVTDGFTTDPNLYQLLYPLWSDLFFLPGYLIANDFGTKLVAYGGMLTLLFVTYMLSRRFLSVKRSLLITLLVSTFQVVAWQASSFYIDVFMAAFILAAFWRLLSAEKHANKSYLYLVSTAAVWLGVAVGSKHFNVVLVAPFFLATFLNYRSGVLAIIGATIAVAVASPWYIHAYLQTGQWLYPAFNHLSDLTATPEQGSSRFLFNRALTFPLSFFKVWFTRDYLSPILLFFLPAVYLVKHKINRPLLALLGLILTEWAIWWFIPPFSTRYALAGFIAAIILIAVWGSQLKNHTLFILLWLAACAIAFLPRVVVNWRSLQYLLSGQSREQYVRQFFDGNADDKLKKWHGLP